MERSWERLPDEPDRWYARFEVYRLIGPNRSLLGVYRLVTQLLGRTGRAPGQAWQQAAQRWNWQARAQAWDTAEEARLRSLLHTQDLDPHLQRHVMVDDLLNAVYAVLTTADLKGMDREEARRVLPTVRGLLRDLLAAHRSEGDTQNGPVAPFTADELRQAQAELERWRSTRRQDDAAPLPQGDWLPLRDALAALYADEASARRVAGQAGLTLTRIAFSPPAVNIWHAILTEAGRAGRMAEVIAVAQDEYGRNADLQRAVTRVLEAN
jgi:hypothetical protein